VSEGARSLLDGHIALSLALAQAARYPAVDVLASTSRTMEMVAGEAHLHDARSLRRAMAVLERVKDARALGIESNEPAVRTAIGAEQSLENFLRQGTLRCDPTTTLSRLGAVATLLEHQDADR
jgi:type III secretion protein N (ATPase)